MVRILKPLVALALMTTLTTYVSGSEQFPKEAKRCINNDLDNVVPIFMPSLDEYKNPEYCKYMCTKAFLSNAEKEKYGGLCIYLSPDHFEGIHEVPGICACLAYKNFPVEPTTDAPAGFFVLSFGKKADIAREQND